MPEEKTEEKVESKAITVNVNKVIKKRNGDALRNSPEFHDDFSFCEECGKKVNAAKGDEMTVRSVCVDALDSMPREQQGEKKIKTKEKFRRGKLAEKIYDSVEPIELNVDDLSLIKKLVGEMNNPLVVSQVFPEIDPKTGDEEG